VMTVKGIKLAGELVTRAYKMLAVGMKGIGYEEASSLKDVLAEHPDTEGIVQTALLNTVERMDPRGCMTSLVVYGFLLGMQYAELEAEEKTKKGVVQ
jgi:hypothetical protein